MRRMVDRQSILDKLSKIVEVNGNSVTFGGNVEIDGNLTQQGEAVGGSKLYRHNIYFDDKYGSLQIITNDETPFTKDSFRNWLINQGNVSPATSLGYVRTYVSSSVITMYRGIYADDTYIRSSRNSVQPTINEGVISFTSYGSGSDPINYLTSDYVTEI